MTQPTTPFNLRSGPDANGLFGAFGGRYVAETLMPLILDLAREYEVAKEDPAFIEELAYFQRDYVGRPSPLYFAERLTEYCGGAKIYLKREELNHTGAHKINNCIGQILLARRMGKKTHHRRDRRRHARCCHCHRRRTFRSGLRDLHGHH